MRRKWLTGFSKFVSTPKYNLPSLAVNLMFCLNETLSSLYTSLLFCWSHYSWKKQSVNVMLQRHSKAESLVDLLPMLSIISQRSPQYEPIERVKNPTLDQRVQVMMWKLTFTIDESNSPKVVVCFINLFSICVQQSHTWTLYTQRKTLMQAWRPSCNFLTGSSGNKAIKTSYVQRSIEQFSAQLLAI